MRLPSGVMRVHCGWRVSSIQRHSSFEPSRRVSTPRPLRLPLTYWPSKRSPVCVLNHGLALQQAGHPRSVDRGDIADFNRGAVRAVVEELAGDLAAVLEGQLARTLLLVIDERAAEDAPVAERGGGLARAAVVTNAPI
jgi:hypothetical protein